MIAAEADPAEELAEQMKVTEAAVGALLEGTGRAVGELRLSALREAIHLGALVEMYVPDERR